MNLFLVSFDPGLKTGVAEWDENAELTALKEIAYDELGSYLQELETRNPEHILLEAWTLWKERNKQGDKQHTVRAIGKIEESARRIGIVPIEQQQQAKDIAAVWAGVKKKKGHMPNMQSAYLHGYYWLYKVKKMIRPRVLDDPR